MRLTMQVDIPKGEGHVNEKAIVAGVALGRLSVRKMEKPEAHFQGVVAMKRHVKARTKIEGEVHPARTWNRSLLGEPHYSPINVEEGLQTPVIAGYELEADRACPAIRCTDGRSQCL